MASGTALLLLLSLSRCLAAGRFGVKVSGWWADVDALVVLSPLRARWWLCITGTPDFTKVPCPKCGATVGSPCRSIGGRKIAAAYPQHGPCPRARREGPTVLAPRKDAANGRRVVQRRLSQALLSLGPPANPQPRLWPLQCSRNVREWP